MSELVDKWEDKTATDMTVWMHRKRSTGGRSVSPHPVVYKCRTCNGTGQREDPTNERTTFAATCTDCVQGWVANIGTIRWLCLLDDDEHPECEYAGQYIYREDLHIGCGLVLVIPIGDPQ